MDRLSNRISFDDLERSLTRILRLQYFSIGNISKTVQDRTIVTIELK